MRDVALFRDPDSSSSIRNKDVSICWGSRLGSRSDEPTNMNDLQTNWGGSRGKEEEGQEGERLYISVSILQYVAAEINGTTPA